MIKNIILGDKTSGQKIAFSTCFSVIGKDLKSFDLQYEISKKENVYTLVGKGALVDNITLTINDDEIICERTLKNESDKSVDVKELCVDINGMDFGGVIDNDYYYSVENNRLFGVCTIPVGFDRVNDTPDNDKFGITVDKRWADPGAINDRILNCPYQPFPAVHLGNYQSDIGVVHGTLCQDVFFHNYSVLRNGNGVCLKAYSAFKAIAYRVIKPGETLTDKWYFGITCNAGDINRIFDGYTRQLRKVIKNPRAKNSTNKNGVIWGSWNDGVYRDVSEDMLLQESAAFKRNFDAATWVQLDDGYATYCDADVDNGAHGLGVVYEGENGIDAKKFPNGMKAYVDKVKELGLKPAVWIGGFVPHQTKLYQEKPQWFIDYSYRVDDTSPLDVSLEESREYMVHALDKFTKEWGFEGIKHDFWSYAFEDSKDLLRNKDKSGYEYRAWWLTEMRKRLPEYGYMQTGCDVSMGNPFLGQYFDNYRFGLDVGSGVWNNVKTTMFWGCAYLSTHTGDLYIPNGDSIGLLKGLCDVDFYFLLNFLLITHSLVEVSGLYSAPNVNQERLKILQKATCGINNGANVYFAKYNYREKSASVPKIMYSDVPCFEDKEFYGEILKTVAIFNVKEQSEQIEFTAKDIGLTEGEYRFTDAWNKESFCADKVSVDLQPHGSKLYYVHKK